MAAVASSSSAADDSANNAALHALLSGGGAQLPEWRDSEWGDMLKLGSDAFARALQQAEHDIEHTLEGPEKAPAVSASEADAFTAWAQRVARLEIIDVDDETRDNEFASAHVPERLKEHAHEHPDHIASLALSLKSDAPENQLLRYKLLLAQEEAKSVHLEDRVSRLLHELAAERAQTDALKAANAALTARNLQQTANSCANGCGLVRIENDKLREQNRTLKRNLATLDQHLTDIVAHMEQPHLPQPDAGASAGATVPPFVARRVSRTRSASGVFSAPDHCFSPFSPMSSPSATSPNRHMGTTPPLEHPAVADAPPSGAAHDGTHSLSLWRVRAALALARMTLRHQSEIDHLMSFKLDYVTLQTRVDDLEERGAMDAEALERTQKELEAKSAQEEALQQVVASLATQLHKFAASGGRGVSVSMSPATASAQDALSPRSAAETEELRRVLSILPHPLPQTTGTGGAASSLQTPPRRSPQNAASAPGSGGSASKEKSWGIGSWFGSSSASKAAHARKQSRQDDTAASSSDTR